MMSKRKNRELARQEAEYRLRRNPDYVAGAMASGVPAEINPALAKASSNDSRLTLNEGRES